MKIDKKIEIKKTLQTFGGRVLALDHSKKNLGIAISDKDLVISSRIGIVTKQKFHQRVKEIRKYCLTFSVMLIVIGNPLKINGEKGYRAVAVEKFKNNLTKELGVPTLLWDERRSTKIVKENLKRKYKNEKTDDLSACFFLQEFLDWLNYPCS